MKSKGELSMTEFNDNILTAEQHEPQAWIQHAKERYFEERDENDRPILDSDGNPKVSTSRGVSLPCPAVGTGGVTISSLVDGGRNANGNFLGTVIGDDKLRYDISFASLNQKEFMQFLAIFDRKQGGGYVQPFWVFDPRINDFVKLDMYIGDRSGRPLMLDGNFQPTRWMDASATLIQV